MLVYLVGLVRLISLSCRAGLTARPAPAAQAALANLKNQGQ